MREASIRQAFVAAVVFATVPSVAFAAELGDRFRHYADCPEMVVAPVGEFVMGSPSDEPGHSEIEEPRHRAAIRRPLAIGRIEVTFAEWDACAAGGGCNGRRPDAAVGGARPVVQVSWNDAIAYTVWLSSKARALSFDERDRVGICGAGRLDGVALLAGGDLCAHECCGMPQQ